jgi:beta-glucanase (GH16 family)
MLAGVLLSAQVASAQRTHLRQMPLSDPKGKWVLRSDYSDEFDGNMLDVRKWNNNIESWGIWSWDPKNVAVSDGALSITMRYEPHQRQGKDLFYKSGAIRSRAEPILYGFFEARIKGAALFPGVCPAFWAFRNEHRTKGLKTELDFVEMQQGTNAHNPKRLDFTSIYWEGPGADGQPIPKPIQRQQSVSLEWDPRDDFHVYGFLWNEKELKWYVDGKLLAEQVNEFFRQPQEIILSMGVRRPLDTTPADKGFPTTMTVDYVRVWQTGVPDRVRGHPTKQMKGYP